jgi:hypothetical protein
VKILKNCIAALAPGGKIVVLDMVSAAGHARWRFSHG